MSIILVRCRNLHGEKSEHCRQKATNLGHISSHLPLWMRERILWSRRLLEMLEELPSFRGGDASCVMACLISGPIVNPAHLCTSYTIFSPDVVSHKALKGDAGVVWHLLNFGMPLPTWLRPPTVQHISFWRTGSRGENPAQNIFHAGPAWHQQG